MDSHKKETYRKAISAMKQVRGIGQRKFVGDFKRRVWMVRLFNKEYFNVQRGNIKMERI